MRRLKPFLPALAVALAAAAVFAWPIDRRSLAEIETPIEELSLAAGEHLDFELALRVLRLPARVGACPTLFLHLRDAEGRTVRQFDHRLASWPGYAELPGEIPGETPGKRVVDRSTLLQSALDEPLAPGNYRLEAGLWDPETDRRYRLHHSVGHRGNGSPARRQTVAEVEITGPSATAPTLDFGDGWSAPEPTDGVHGRNRRGWSEAAEIEIGPSPESLELRLVIDLPPWAAPRAGAGLEIECTGEILELKERWQEIRLPLPQGEPCRLRFPPIDAVPGEVPGEVPGGDSGRVTGGLLYALSWAESPDDAPSSACIRAL